MIKGLASLDGFFFRLTNFLTMDSSDEDFLPDPDRPKQVKEPPDRIEVSKGRGKKRKRDDPVNQQSGLNLHDDFAKGKCFFFLLEVNLKSELCSDK